MTQREQLPTQIKQTPPPKPGAPEVDILDMSGVLGLLAAGKEALTRKRSENMTIIGLVIALIISGILNLVLFNYTPEPKLLGETPDGRIRPLPLLSEPLYNTAEILAWSENCVQKMYGLSYVDWQKTVSNETTCLSDANRKSFVQSLREIGALDLLTEELQGTMYASPMGAIFQGAKLTERGYKMWKIEVPFRLRIDGKRRVNKELVAVMLVRRVSLNVRSDGIWVDKYQILPKRPTR